MVYHIIMVTLPIEKKLKKRLHRNIALAQDILIMEVYDHFLNTVIHGDLAIWRCYGSNRFSETVDVYLPVNLEEKNINRFLMGLKEKGFVVQKFKMTKNTVFSKFSYLDVIVSFEAVLKEVKNFVIKRFELVDGNFIFVNTLRPEEMIEEKVLAYLKRRKVRDLYDIFFLLNFVEEREKVRKILENFLKDFKEPEDEKELKVLIISGSVPRVEEMVEEIRRWVK